MTAKVVNTLPEGSEWIYEVKLDGYRALVTKHDGHVRISVRATKSHSRIHKWKPRAGG